MTATATPNALRQIADLPQPKAGWLLGHALQVKPVRIHRDVEAWARQHGPLFRMRFGRTTMLAVADHELLGAILRDRPDGFQRTPEVRNVGLEMGLPPGLFGSEGESWRNQRRMVMASFAPNHVLAYFPSLAKVTQRLQDRWLTAASSGQSIDLQGDLMRYTVDTIAGLALGADINTLQAGDDIIQQHLDKVLPAIFHRVLALVPYWRWFKLKRDHALDRSVVVINATIARFVQQARQQMRDDPALRERPANLLQAMLASADTPGSGITDREVSGNVLTALLAGEDTTANSLAWLIDLLYRHPATLARARAEVQAVLGAACGQPEQFSPEHMAQLPYLEACINESMRLKPVAPFITLQALRDTVVGDVHVPKGSLVWGLFRHDSVSEPYFPNPQAFEPTRWLGDDASAHAQTSAKRVAMPFGAGPRVCPGRYLALLEMKMAMAMLLSRFEIAAVEAPGGGPTEERMYFTMAPRGLRMKLAVRVEVPQGTSA